MTESNLKEILEKQVFVLDEINSLNREIKELIAKRKDKKRLEEVSKIANEKIKIFEELEKQRESLWLLFINKRPFESTYQAIEKFAEVHKDSLLKLVHELKLKLLNLKSITYLIQNYVETSMDIVEFIFQNIEEQQNTGTYAKPYSSKKTTANRNVLINKTL